MKRVFYIQRQQKEYHVQRKEVWKLGVVPACMGEQKESTFIIDKLGLDNEA